MKDTKRIKIIWQFVKPFKMAFINLFICVIVTSFIGMLYPYIFGMLVDEVFYHRNMDFFKIIVISYGVIYIGEQLLHLILNSTWAYLMTRYLFDIRKRIFDKIFILKADYLSNIQTGDLITRINKDAEEFMNFIHWNVFYLFANIVRLLISVALVAVLNIKIAALMFIVVPITVYTSRFFAKKVRIQYKKYRDVYGKYISWMFEILGGMREIQLLAGERNVIRKFIKSCSSLIRLKIKSSLIEVGSERSNAFISLSSNLMLYIVAGVFIVNGELTVGGFIAIIDYFTRSTNLLKGLNDANIKIQNNMVSIDRVYSLLNEESEKQDKTYPDISVNGGRIEFKNVKFQYNEHNHVLKNINLAINEGEKISFVGRSGAGKSTLVNLLLRFYDPCKGTIKINGTDIQGCSLKSLRKNIGIVQQETLFFDGTIKYNLKLGNPRCSDGEIWEACEKAHIAEFVRSLPDGLDTVIGTDGINFSGGQRQRLAIARVFLKNPPILIFDEATSALDYEAEQVIKKSWKELSCGRTTIIIAHRLTTILDSDKVAVLHGGEIVSFDHHLKLLENCEHYRSLFSEQYITQEDIAG
ncbi:MAG: ABC transporter ATP-binding protein/permease [Clostridia bacterium]|nr:ABC transporter ATP-binding protein/permease [Clostridia bacterium]